MLFGVTYLPFLYKVSIVREGKGYVQRRVDVVQEDEKLMFTCVCSFKLPESNPVERVNSSRLEEQYKSVLEGKPLDRLPEAPGVDSPL